MKNGIVFLKSIRTDSPVMWMTSDVQKIGSQNTIVFAEDKRHPIFSGGRMTLSRPADYSACGMGLWLPPGVARRVYEPQVMAVLERDNAIVAGAALTAHAVYSIAANRNPKDLIFGADNSYGGCLPVYLAWATSGHIEHVGEPENIAFRLASLLGTIIARREVMS